MTYEPTDPQFAPRRARPWWDEESAVEEQFFGDQEESTFTPIPDADQFGPDKQ